MSEKIFILAVSGSREKLQMAAMTASVGAVCGAEVTVLLSMNALPPFVRGQDNAVFDEGDLGRLIVEKKAPSFLHLFEQAVELGGARVHPCSMTMDIMGLKQENLPSFMAKPLGLTRLLSEASGGQTWSF